MLARGHGSIVAAGAFAAITCALHGCKWGSSGEPSGPAPPNLTDCDRAVVVAVEQPPGDSQDVGCFAIHLYQVAEDCCEQLEDVPDKVVVDPGTSPEPIPEDPEKKEAFCAACQGQLSDDVNFWMERYCEDSKTQAPSLTRRLTASLKEHGAKLGAAMTATEFCDETLPNSCVFRNGPDHKNGTTTVVLNDTPDDCCKAFEAIGSDDEFPDESEMNGYCLSCSRSSNPLVLALVAEMVREGACLPVPSADGTEMVPNHDAWLVAIPPLVNFLPVV